MSLEEDDLMQADEIIEVCGSLIDYDAASGIVTFSHEMVQEFLKSRYSNRLLGRDELCKAILTYMSFNVFREGPSTNEASHKARLDKHPFGLYVAKYWGRHVKEVEEDNPELYEMVLKVISSGAIVDSMTQLAIAEKSRDWDIPARDRGKKEMHVLAEHNLVLFAEEYLNYQEFASGLSTGGSDDQGEENYWEALLRYDKVSVCTDALTRPLHLASKRGHKKMVEILLKAGAKVDVQNDLGETPLQLACEEGHCGVVKSLLEAQASVEIEDVYGCGPLHSASKNGSIDIITTLFEANPEIKIDSKSKNGVTPFLCALNFGNLEAGRKLQEMNADNCITTPYGLNAFHSIALGGDTKLFDLSPPVDMVDINSKYDKEMWTPLYLASDYGNLEVAQRLLNLGADLHISCENGRLPLHVACREGHIGVVEALIEAGADLNIGDDHGWVALHYAARNNYKPLVEKLLEAGALVEAMTTANLTALSLAVKYGHKDIVEQLLGAGANPLIVFHDGHNSPLVIAVSCGYVEIGQLLLAKLGIPFVCDPDVIEISLPKNFENSAARHQFLQHVTKAFPDDSRLRAYLADFYFSQGLYDLAIANYDVSLSLDSRNLHITETQDIAHVYICDACRIDPIRGIRYRCVKCDDYDLCQNCMDRRPRPHSEHELIRIPSEQWIVQHLSRHAANLQSPRLEAIGTTMRAEVTAMDIDG